MISPAVEVFFEKHSFSEIQPGSETLMAEFDRQMTAGLAGHASSLRMLPAYISGDSAASADQPVMVMDAGGTNLRVAVANFDRYGEVSFSDFNVFPMPGSGGQELSSTEFFDSLAGYLEPLAGSSDRLGLCFSYATEITPDCDGRLLYWSKQIRAGEVVGKFVGSETARAFRKRTGRNLRVKVLNDTVATLLSGLGSGGSGRYSGHIGFIMGTGTNTAYSEKVVRIAGLKGVFEQDNMIINIESGNFDGVPQSVLDRKLEETLFHKEGYQLERMMSGAYLGSLGLCVLQEAAREGLFSAGAGRGLLALESVSSRDLDEFTANPFKPGTVFDRVEMTDADRRTAVALGLPLFRRAARLAAVNIAAVVLRSGAGHDILHPACVTVDGSTFYRTKSANFRSRIEQHVRELLEPRGIACEINSVEDAPLTGAAVAAASI